MRRVAFTAVAVAVLVPALAACSGGGASNQPSVVPAKALPSPIFDDLQLGMTRAETAHRHRIRPSLTAGGRNFRVWLYDGPGTSSVTLTFNGRDESDTLRRIDVHYGLENESADSFIARFEKLYGAPDVRRREAVINSYGDVKHRQFETIWSDGAQVVFLTERVPLPGRGGEPAYFLTIRKRELRANGPPTGYVPPPQVDKDGNPIEEPVF